MISTITREWVFVTAQTNVAIVTFGATERGILYGAVATCSNSNTGDVSVRVGFAAATLPTISDDSATGSLGVPVSHPGIAHGGGFVWGGGGSPIGVGAVGEDIRITCSAATGGSLRIVLMYWLEEFA